MESVRFPVINKLFSQPNSIAMTSIDSARKTLSIDVLQQFFNNVPVVSSSDSLTAAHRTKPGHSRTTERDELFTLTQTNTHPKNVKKKTQQQFFSVVNPAKAGNRLTERERESADKSEQEKGPV